MALHEWTDSVVRVNSKAKRLNVKRATPIIDESITVGEQYLSKNGG